MHEFQLYSLRPTANSMTDLVRHLDLDIRSRAILPALQLPIQRRGHDSAGKHIAIISRGMRRRPKTAFKQTTEMIQATSRLPEAAELQRWRFQKKVESRSQEQGDKGSELCLSQVLPLLLVPSPYRHLAECVRPRVQRGRTAP